MIHLALLIFSDDNRGSSSTYRSDRSDRADYDDREYGRSSRDYGSSRSSYGDRDGYERDDHYRDRGYGGSSYGGGSSSYGGGGGGSGGGSAYDPLMPTDDYTKHTFGDGPVTEAGDPSVYDNVEALFRQGTNTGINFGMFLFFARCITHFQTSTKIFP